MTDGCGGIGRGGVIESEKGRREVRGIERGEYVEVGQGTGGGGVMRKYLWIENLKKGCVQPCTCIIYKLT